MGVAAGVAWVALTAAVLLSLGFGTLAEQVAWALMVLVPAAVFAAGCVVAGARCTGQRRRFWRIVAIGMAFQSTALIWRAGALVAGVPINTTDVVYSILTTCAVLVFAAGLVVRMRMLAPATWIVQFLDAAGLAVVVTTLTMLPIATRLESAAVDGKANAVQPLVLALIAAGALSLLFTPVPWHKKRVEIVLAVTMILALGQSWLELYGIVLSGSRFLPLVGITLAAAFCLGVAAPFLEDPHTRIVPIPREDYDNVAWPYVALSVLPLAALAAVLRGSAAVETVAIAGLLAGLLVAVLRQVQVLRTQRVLLGLARAHTDERIQDAAIGRSLLDVARKLAVSSDRVDAERAVLNALAVATTAPMVRIIEPDGAVTGDPSSSASLGPEAAIALVRDARGDMAPSAPRHFHDPAADVEGVLVAASTTGGEVGAVLYAEGKGWKPAPNEVDLVSGLAHQLGVALERAELAGRLGRSERLYRRIIDAVPVGVVEIDPRGTVRRSNQAFSRMTGLTDRRISGTDAFELFAQIEVEPEDALERFMREGETRFRARVVTFEGVERMLAVDATRLGREREDGRDVVCFIRDDTEIVRLRRRVGRAAADVEARRTTAQERHAATMSALAADALTRLYDASAAMSELGRAPAVAVAERLEAARASVTATVHTVQALVEVLESHT